MQLIFEQIRTGGDRNFGYLLGDRDARDAVLIDPSYAPDALVQRARDQGLTVRHIVNTHSHPDHTNGNAEAARLTGAPIAAHPSSPTAPDVALDEGGTLNVGALRLRLFHTPGHCADHIVLYEAAAGILITGDLIFVGKVGGTRSDADATAEWDSLQRLLSAIPDPVTIWPGHDYGVRPSSTMGMEKTTNPFLQCADLAAFLQIKIDWPALKKERGLK